MKEPLPDYVEDVEELLEKTVLEEATQAVWKAFEQTLQKLDEESLRLLEEHFEGATVQDLSQKYSLSANQVETWLTKAKQEVGEGIRRESTVRQ